MRYYYQKEFGWRDWTIHKLGGETAEEAAESRITAREVAKEEGIKKGKESAGFRDVVKNYGRKTKKALWTGNGGGWKNNKLRRIGTIATGSGILSYGAYKALKNKNKQ